MPAGAVSSSALALTTAGRADQKQLAVQAQRYALADYALKVCGLVRPGCENASEKQPNDFSVDGDCLTQMKEVVRTRGVKQRLEDDFDLKIGEGEDVPEKESQEDFLSRTILQLRKTDVKDVIKLFDRVERNNRKAVAHDTAFQANMKHFKKKVAEDDAEEKYDDEEHGTLHNGSPESYAEFEDWCQQFEYRDGEKDFACFAGGDVTRGSNLKPDDGTFAGYDLTKIRDALRYFQQSSKPTEVDQDGHSPASDADTIKSQPVKTTRPDANVIKAELAKWSPAFVVSSYRRLSLIKHPDKEGGSPEAFQELTEHSRVLTEACAKFHGITIKKTLSRKRQGTAPFAKGAAAKVAGAICMELPAHLKIAVAFFGLTDDNVRVTGPAEIKKLRQLLSAEKDRRDKELQRTSEPDKLVELLRQAQEEDEVEDLGSKNLKQLKLLSLNLCKAHYASVYGHIQKLK